MDAGHLPNIQRLFGEGGQIRHALSLYPGGTEIIYPRLKTGTSNGEGYSVGWGVLDREKGRVISGAQIVLGMLDHLPERSRGFFLYGVPGLQTLAALSLLNVPDILDTYGYAEVLWYGTDVQGHLFGPKAPQRLLHRFDEAIGRYLPQDALEDVNVILYADHGMSFGEIELVDLLAIVDKTLGPEVEYYSYPNIYLSCPEGLDAKAQALVAAGVDFVFYRDGSRVVGRHPGGTVYLAAEDRLVRYTFSGSDPFGYYAAGYTGEAWSKEEWLEFSKELKFPALPPNVYSYLQNPHVGDLVISLTPPKLLKSLAANRGNHAGLTATDLLVPVLFKGPDLGHRQGRDTMWLHELYTKYVSVDFAFVPARDQNSMKLLVTSQGLQLGLKLSPAHGVRGSLEIQGRHSAALAAEFDLYSSFLSRLWLGAGARLAGEGTSIFLQGTYELTLGRLAAVSRFSYHLGPPKASRCQRGTGMDPGQHKEGPLAQRQQPNPENFTLQNAFVSDYYSSVKAKGVTFGTAGYRTVCPVLWEVGCSTNAASHPISGRYLGSQSTSKSASCSSLYI